MATTDKRPWIFHVSSRDTIRSLRDDILRLNGFEVRSTRSFHHAVDEMEDHKYDLVLIDVEGRQVAESEKLCEEIKKAYRDQQVAFVCNHRVAIESDCPDEIIRAEFNPEALVRGIKEFVSKN